MHTQNVLLNRTAELSPVERDVLERSISEIKVIPAGHILVRQGEEVKVSTLLVEGIMTRHVDTADGHRHLVTVHIPGDFVDLHGYALKRLDHDVGALTEVRVALFPHAAIERIQDSNVPLTKRLWFCTLLDAALHRQWIFRLASLTALQRVAHFICESNARLLAIGVSDSRRFAFPLTQADIGEVCSLSNVHVNRVLRQLREARICEVRSGHVEIFDLPRLVSTGLFKPDYLYLNRLTARRSAGEDWSSDD